MSEQIIEAGWNEGWIPSSSEQADFGAASRGLLRMDNLTLDEKGTLRLANRAGNEGSIANQINSIYAAYVNGKKLRYLYSTLGKLLRNYGAGTSLTVYDLTIGTGGTQAKAFFGNFLGHVVAVSGALQFKDRGDIQWPLTIPQPVAPTLVNGAAFDIDLRNLAAGAFTNWLSIETSAYNNAGANVQFTPAVATNRAIFQTIYAVAIDTTNFGSGTGFDTPLDQLVFSLQIDDPTQLNYFKVELILQDPTTGITDEYWAELDYANFATNTNPNNPYVPSIPFTISPATITAIYINRSSFQRIGSNDSLGWNTVKAFRFTVGTFATANLIFYAPFYHSGSVKGLQSYVCVELNDTGQFVQFSIASTQVTLTAALSQVTVSRPTACNAQCNNVRFYRNNVTLGQFIEVNRQTGAYGFTPAGFLDTLNDQDALAAAAIDTTKILNYFRTQLPTNIIGMIYFASRVIYLSKTSFFPSYQLDFGSYDSRFTYELTGTNSEICFFITRLSVGTFIVATSVDFYQVTGTFALVNQQLPDGTVITTQDVNVLALGISDPAINSSFIEVEGNILYMSARGLRSMSNGNSALLNTSTDLLFRDEARYGFPAIDLQPNDLSLIGMVSSGSRVYLGLPFTNGQNAVLVSTFNPPAPAELRGSNYWRPLTYAAALCMCRELDGTVLYGDSSGNVGSLENSFSGAVTIDFLTQFNFGQHPSQTKTIGSFLIYVNTGGVALTLTINGLNENGSITAYTTTLNSNGLKVVWINPSQILKGCLAYQIQITGTTSVFELNYILMLVIEEYPPLTFYALVPFSNFGKDTVKKLSKWGFVADTLGNQVSVKATADNVGLVTDLATSLEPQGIETQFWFNDTDLIAVDWQLEVFAPQGMHFFKFMPPDVLQVFPPGRKIDQFGPLDLDREGIVFAFRIRLYNTTDSFHYKVFDQDTVLYENDITTQIGKDSTYEDEFPKGINTSVFRMILSATAVFYRFSLEVKVRTTGKETEQKWVKL